MRPESAKIRRIRVIRVLFKELPGHYTHPSFISLSMSFPLLTFEQYLSSSIAGRGLEYYERGAVANLARDGNTYIATVYGTEAYEVKTTIRDGQVESWGCNCPYDYGPACKHVAAVLFEVREVENDPERAVGVAEEQANEPVDAILALLPEEEMRQLLKFFARRYDEVRVHLLTKYANRIADAGPGHYKRLVEAIINGYTGGEHGFIGYQEAKKLGRELYGLAEDALKEVAAGEEMQLALLCEEIIRQLSQAVEYTDDYSSLGTAIEHAFSILQNLCEKEKDTPEEVVTYLYNLSLEECDKELYEGRLWEGSWRFLAADAARNKAQVNRLLKKLDAFIAQKDGQGYSREYEAESAAKLKLQLLEVWHTPEEAESFLKDNLAFPALRRIALEQAFAAKRYEEARHLAEEGIVLDTKNKLPGLVREWKEWVRKVGEAGGG